MLILPPLAHAAPVISFVDALNSSTTVPGLGDVPPKASVADCDPAAAPLAVAVHIEGADE